MSGLSCWPCITCAPKHPTVEVVMAFTIPTRRLLPPVAVFTLFMLAPVMAALAQTTGGIDWAVTAVAGGRPLSDVQVTIVGTTLGGRTDEQGRYRIGAVPAGSHQIRTQRIGFASVTRPITVASGQTATLNFSI